MSDTQNLTDNALTYAQLRELVEKEIGWHLEVAARQGEDPERDYDMACIHGYQARALIELLFRAGMACGNPDGLADESNAMVAATDRRFEAVKDVQLSRQHAGRSAAVA